MKTQLLGHYYKGEHDNTENYVHWIPFDGNPAECLYSTKKTGLSHKNKEHISDNLNALL